MSIQGSRSGRSSAAASAMRTVGATISNAFQTSMSTVMLVSPSARAVSVCRLRSNAASEEDRPEQLPQTCGAR
eukprot:4845271-Pyramimonas_sp.AAC.1